MLAPSSLDVVGFNYENVAAGFIWVKLESQVDGGFFWEFITCRGGSEDCVFLALTECKYPVALNYEKKGLCYKGIMGEKCYGMLKKLLATYTYYRVAYVANQALLPTLGWVIAYILYFYKWPILIMHQGEKPSQIIRARITKVELMLLLWHSFFVSISIFRLLDSTQLNIPSSFHFACFFNVQVSCTTLFKARHASLKASFHLVITVWMLHHQ